jgi:hypothetical protein
MNKTKTIIIFLLFLLFGGCASSVSTRVNSPSPNPKSFSQIKSINIEDVDTNKDNVIDKEELIAFQETHTPDSSNPLYVVLFISIFTFVMCLIPGSCSFVKNKIKKRS